MVDMSIVEYIIKYEKDGFSEAEIRDSLLSQDISKEIINKAYDEIKKNPGIKKEIFKKIKADEGNKKSSQKEDTTKVGKIPHKKALEKKTQKENDANLSDSLDDDDETQEPFFGEGDKKDEISLQKKVMLLFGFLFFVGLAFYLLKLSNIDSSIILTPLSEFLKISKGESNINYALIVFAILSYSLGISTISYYAVLRHRDDFIIYTSALLALICGFVFFGLSLLGGLFSFGFGAAIAFFISKVDDKKEHYRKLHYSEISMKAYRHSFIILSILIAVGLYFTLAANPDFAESEIENMMASSGIDLEDNENMEQSILNKQREATHQMLSGVENALLMSMKTDPEIEVQCYNKVEEKMQVVDQLARVELDKQLDNSLNEDSGTINQVQRLSNILNVMKSKYAWITAFSMFLVFEFIKGLVAMIVYLQCYVIGLITNIKAKA